MRSGKILKNQLNYKVEVQISEIGHFDLSLDHIYYKL